jgi:hypothetical protein
METKPFALRLNTDGCEFVYVTYPENGVEIEVVEPADEDPAGDHCGDW